MTTCQARLPLGQRPRLTVNANGFPEVVERRCRQSVGVLSWWDLLNIQRASCSLPGHREDVLAESESAVEAERARHDLQPEPPCYEPMWRIRPEWRSR